MDAKRYGDNVREHRRKRGWTVEEFARRVGVSEQTVRNWEYSRVEMREEYQILVAQLLRMPRRLLRGDPRVAAHAPRK